MRVRYLAPILACLVVLLPASAADLAKVDRSIANEPVYRSGAPRYCLLVFGPDAASRVWLVRDGDTLYADKNGNGDLTEAGEKIAAQKDGTDRAFRVGTVRVGGREHRHLTVRASRLSGYGDAATSHPVSRAALQKDRDVDLMSVSAEVALPGLKGGGDDGRLVALARMDANGPLLFAAARADAPVLHLGGPLQLQAEAAQPTLYHNVVHDLMLIVGTPGLGPGTFTQFGYEGLVPGKAFVVAEAEFPPSRTGDPPIRQRFELKERC
jgi:hypothetical protein